MKAIIPLTAEQLEAIRSPQDALTILRSVVESGDQLLHPELNRIVTQCVVVLESGVKALTRQLQRAYPHGIPVRIEDPGPSRYDAEPTETEE
jgi:hypothetical protein